MLPGGCASTSMFYDCNALKYCGYYYDVETGLGTAIPQFGNPGNNMIDTCCKGDNYNMDEWPIEYKPYKYERYFGLFLVFGFVFILFPAFISVDIVEKCVAIPLVGVCIISIKLCYDLGKIIIFFESSGVRIINDRSVLHRYIPWENLHYAYYTRNYKGHTLLLLSPEELLGKERKKVVKKSNWLVKNCIDNKIVIPIGNMKEEKAHQIKAFMLERGLEIL